MHAILEISAEYESCRNQWNEFHRSLLRVRTHARTFLQSTSLLIKTNLGASRRIENTRSLIRERLLAFARCDEGPKYKKGEMRETRMQGCCGLEQLSLLPSPPPSLSLSLTHTHGMSVSLAQYDADPI